MVMRKKIWGMELLVYIKLSKNERFRSVKKYFGAARGNLGNYQETVTQYHTAS
jgi:hypothetical protein